MDAKDLVLIKKISNDKNLKDEEKIRILEALFPSKIDYVPTLPMCPCPSYPPSIPFWTTTVSGTDNTSTFGIDCGSNDDNFSFTFGGIVKKDEDDKD